MKYIGKFRVLCSVLFVKTKLIIVKEQLRLFITLNVCNYCFKKKTSFVKYLLLAIYKSIPSVRQLEAIALMRSKYEMKEKV